MVEFGGFRERAEQLRAAQASLLVRKNRPAEVSEGGWFLRYRNPVLTADHVPLTWRYDFNPATNPLFLERHGVNAVFNPGALHLDGQTCLVCRVEGYDRKSFFAVARSAGGLDQFLFDPSPIILPESGEPDVNVYDMRLVCHEDGWIYGTFCTERRDPSAAPHDTSAAVAACGIVRSKDLSNWQRLPDLASSSPQQRNVVLHPEFVEGRYALYTRPQDGFIEAGSGGGIAWALTESMEAARVDEQRIIEPRVYHTVKEVKNGMGAAPILTDEGWLHIAHGVRSTAAGLRYVLYCFLCARDEPWRVIARPGGYFMAPRGDERVGDVSNVLFCNGVVALPNGDVRIYYASSDTRIHVAATTVERLAAYVRQTPEDPLSSRACVEQRLELLEANRRLLSTSD